MSSPETVITSARNVLVGVTGGIAVYKAVELVRLLVKEGYGVTVVATEAAERFVMPLTFAAVSQQPVLDDHTSWQAGQGWFQHIDAARQAQVLVDRASHRQYARQDGRRHGRQPPDGHLPRLPRPGGARPEHELGHERARGHAKQRRHARRPRLHRRRGRERRARLRGRGLRPHGRAGSHPGGCAPRFRRPGARPAGRPPRRGHGGRHARGGRRRPLPRQPLERKDGARRGRCVLPSRRARHAGQHRGAGGRALRGCRRRERRRDGHFGERAERGGGCARHGRRRGRLQAGQTSRREDRAGGH